MIKKVKKRDFSKIKKAFKIDDIDVNKILVCKESAYGTNKSCKYFIGIMTLMISDLYA